MNIPMNTVQRVLLITGMSGAGKSVALNALEDLGFVAIDNVPLSLITDVVEKEKGHRSLVISTDVRTREFSPEYFEEILNALASMPDVHVDTLFLDCEEEKLRQRFTETRRKHPLAMDRPLMDGIQAEQEMTQNLKEMVELVLDTTDLKPAELRSMLQQRYDMTPDALALNVVSFSYRRGVPREADLVFDVRFLRNPHYDRNLRPRTGLDAAVGAYVEEDPMFEEFFSKLCGLLVPLLPRYMAEGKSYLTVAVGCTGGKHRSVHVAQKLAGFLEKKAYNVGIRHRDVGQH